MNESRKATLNQPLSIYSIDDLDEWRQNFFYPMPLQVGENIESGICDILIEGYSRIPDQLKTHYRIASKAVFLETFDLLMKLSMVKGMHAYKDGVFFIRNMNVPSDVNFPQRCMTYDLYRGLEEPEFPDLRLSYHDRYYLSLKRWRKLGKRVKGLLENISRKSATAKNTYCITPNALTIEYITKNKKRDYRLIRPELVFGSNHKYHGPSPRVGNRFVDWFMSQLNRIFNELTGHKISSKIASA